MIFAPFECALEGAFEWCKNRENPIKIDQFQMQKLLTLLDTILRPELYSERNGTDLCPAHYTLILMYHDIDDTSKNHCW